MEASPSDLLFHLSNFGVWTPRACSLKLRNFALYQWLQLSLLQDRGVVEHRRVEKDSGRPVGKIKRRLK
jgi:hypothetical protein